MAGHKFDLNYDLKLQLSDYFYDHYFDEWFKFISLNKDLYPQLTYTLRKKYRHNLYAFYADMGYFAKLNNLNYPTSINKYSFTVDNIYSPNNYAIKAMVDFIDNYDITAVDRYNLSKISKLYEYAIENGNFEVLYAAERKFAGIFNQLQDLKPKLGRIIKNSNNNLNYIKYVINKYEHVDIDHDYIASANLEVLKFLHQTYPDLSYNILYESAFINNNMIYYSTLKIII